jgi:RluA family pseudouridine synthase
MAYTAADVQKWVIFEDNKLIALNKPPGLPVHGGPQATVHLEALLPALKGTYAMVPQLVHRLDTDTSGVLVVGRHSRTVKQLNRAFAEKTTKKTYYAIVQGVPPQMEGVISARLSKKSTKARGWWVAVDPAGQVAETTYTCLGSGMCDGQVCTWLQLQPQTGRTHQLRVHLAHIGCPILGDPMYGARKHYTEGGARLPRMFLHAAELAVQLSPQQPWYHFQADMPVDMIQYTQEILK